METFIIRIYRRLTGKPEDVVGITEHVESGEKNRFENIHQLIKMILESKFKDGKPSGNHEEI